MDDQSPPLRAQEPTAGAPGRRALWPLAAVAIVAVLGAGAGAYFGLRGAAGPGSGPGASPSARAFAAAAYDEASHQVVLFGGIGAEGAVLNDTWTWDGSTWKQQHPTTSPPARAFAAMTYDPNAHDVVLVGGRAVSYSPPTVCSGSITAGGPNATPGIARPPVACKANPPTEFADTWVWNGSTWRPAGTSPTTLLGETPALGTDPTTGQVLMVGDTQPVGMNPACPSPAPSFPPGLPIPQVAIPCMTPPPPVAMAWVWRGASWTALTAGSPPSEPWLPFGGPAALVADPTSGHLMDVRPGINCGGPVSPATAVPCPLSQGASGATSSSGSAAVPPPDPLIPPRAALPVPQATAIGATASPVPAPVVSAPAAQGPVVMPPTSIPSPKVVTCCSVSVTTWTGSAWSNLKTFSSGPQVGSSGIAGDPSQHAVVAVTPQGTWTWNGSTWTAEHPAASPPPAEGGSLVYDGVSKKLLLFGGEPIATFKPSNPGTQSPALAVSDELWAWDGSTWTQLAGAKASPVPSLPPSSAPTFVPPGTPVPGSPAPLPTPRSLPCTPAPTETPTPMPTKPPTPTPARGGGSGSGCGILVPPTSG